MELRFCFCSSSAGHHCRVARWSIAGKGACCMQAAKLTHSHASCGTKSMHQLLRLPSVIDRQQDSLAQAAVNVSLIQGQLNPERAKAMSSRGRGIDPQGGQSYSAAALSLVYHPAHPHVPTLRADVRLFEVQAWPSMCIHYH